MKKPNFVFLMLLMLGLFFINDYAQEQIGEGDAVPWLHGLIQKWFYVDNNRKIVTIAGTISEIEYTSHGHWYDDLDWCIFIHPDSMFDWCKHNSLNQKNCDGLIECEVKSRKTDIKQFFSPGDLVIAKGKWVEDTGHGASNFDWPARWVLDGLSWKEIRGKTELHPLTLLKTNSSIYSPNTIGTFSLAPTKIFMAQDASGRFYAADETPIEESFVFKANDNTNPNFWVNILENESGVGFVDVYRETAHIKGGAKARLNHVNEALTYNVWIPPYNGGDGGAFMGVFLHEKTPLLKYKTSEYLITHTQPGTDELKIQVELELLNPNGTSLSRSWWAWEENFLDGTLVWLSIEDYDKISYELTYAPSRGLSNSYWGLYVLGNSKDWDWFPVSTTSPSERVTVVSRCALGFFKSYAAYTKEALQSTYPSVHSVWGYRIKSDLNLIKHASLINDEWYIKVLIDGNGNVIPNPVETRIVPGDQDIQGLHVKADSDGVRIDFNSVVVPTEPVFINNLLCTSFTRVLGSCQIIYRGKTNFGEALEFSTEELQGQGGAPNCTEFVIYPDPHEIWKYFMAAQELGLNRLPILPTFTPPLPPLPGWADLIKKLDNVEYVSPGEIYKLVDKFNGENKRAAEAYLKYIYDSSKLSTEEWKLLFQVQRIASSIPAFKIHQTKNLKEKPQFGEYSYQLLRQPHDILLLSKPNIKRTRSFWKKLLKSRLPIF